MFCLGKTLFGNGNCLGKTSLILVMATALGKHHLVMATALGKQHLVMATVVPTQQYTLRAETATQLDCEYTCSLVNSLDSLGVSCAALDLCVVSQSQTATTICNSLRVRLVLSHRR